MSTNSMALRKIPFGAAPHIHSSLSLRRVRPAPEPPRKVALVDLLQSTALDMGVDLRSGNTCMPQHRLHRTQVRPVIEQMGGKRMPEHVRRDRRSDPGPLGLLSQERPEVLPSERPSASGHEHVRRRATFQHGRPSRLDVSSQLLPGDIAHGHDALLASFAGHEHTADVELQIVHSQSHQLRHAEPRGIEQFDHGRIALMLGTGAGPHLEQGRHILFGERPWKHTAAGRTAKWFYGIAGDEMLVQQKSKESAERREIPHPRSCRAAAAQRLRKKRLHVGGRGAPNVTEAAARQREEELLQVGPVRLDTVDRQPPFDAKMGQVSIEQDFVASLDGLGHDRRYGQNIRDRVGCPQLAPTTRHRSALPSRTTLRPRGTGEFLDKTGVRLYSRLKS